MSAATPKSSKGDQKDSDDLSNISALNFVQSIIPDLNGEYVEIRVISNSGAASTHFYDEWEEFRVNLTKFQELQAKEQRTNLFFSVCPRRFCRGNKDAVGRVFVLWTDIDDKMVAGGRKETKRIIESFPFEPSFIIDSGHGFHCYWRLKEPFIIGNAYDRSQVESTLKNICHAIHGDMAVTQVAQIMRIPKTLNIKSGMEPVNCSIIKFDPEREYNFGDFEVFGPPTSATKSGDSATPDHRIASALDGLKNGNRNITFTQIIGRLHHNNFSNQDIKALLRPHAIESDFPQNELDKTVDGITTRYPSRTPFQFPPLNNGNMETESQPLEPISLTNLFESFQGEIEWRIEGILPIPAVGILAGPPGVGKSWMLMDLALEVARGGNWLGKYPTKKGSVLYIDSENAGILLANRLKKMARCKKMDTEIGNLHFLVGQNISLTRPNSVTQLQDVLDKLRPDLVVIDSFIRMHQSDENSATEMARVSETIMIFRQRFGCSFFIADHTRKEGQARRPDSMLRGSSEKLAFIDSLLTVSHKEDCVVVEHAKSRFAQSIPSFLVEITDPSDDETLVAFRGEADQGLRSKKEDRAIIFLKTQIDTRWVGRKILIKNALTNSIPGKLLDRVLSNLVENGTIERKKAQSKTGRGGKQHFYRVNPKTIG